MAGLARKLSTVMDAVTNDVLAPQREQLDSTWLERLSCARVRLTDAEALPEASLKHRRTFMRTF